MNGHPGVAVSAPQQPARRKVDRGYLGLLADLAGWQKIRASLFYKYVGLFLIIVSLALLSNGLSQIWFSYREHEASLVRIQREQAKAAADKISQFIGEIEKSDWVDDTLAVVGRYSRATSVRRSAPVASGAGDHRVFPT